MYNKWYNMDMDSLSSSSLRADLAKVMKQVWDNREPLLITRKGGKPVVMMSLDDYRALEETAYLLRNPANAKRLRDSIESLEKGKGQVRELVQ